MPLQIFASFLFYSFICGITPGPANLASLAASLQYGRRAFLKQWIGLFWGFFTDAVAASILLYFFGTVLNEYVKYLAIVGAVYMMYLAWKMFRTSLVKNEETDEQDKEVDEPNFWTGFFLQLTNVKVIMTCFTAISSYVLPVYQTLPLIMAWGIPVVLVGPVSNLVWGFSGLALKKLFDKYQKAVGIVMALSLMGCAISLISIIF